MGAVPTKVRQPAIRADVATRAAVERLLVVVGQAGTGMFPARLAVGTALGATSEAGPAMDTLLKVID